MGRARADRGRRSRAPEEAVESARARSDERGASCSPRSPVFIGLCAVVLAVPVAVLGGASGPYDDPKAWALPILVAATVLGWLAWSPAQPPSAGSTQDAATRILRSTVVAYAAWSVITTVTSIAPAQSLLGNFGRGMGLLTVGSATVLFFLVRHECKTPEAIRALIDAALLGSAPVCLLALGQVIGWDPLPRSWDPAVATLTVRSTFGQHIILGSYLVVLVPLAAARLDCSLRRWRAPGPDDARVTRRAFVAGALWIAGVLALVGLASRWAPAWWALVPWGVAGAFGWTFTRKPGGESFRAPVAVALLGALVSAQVLVVLMSAARGPLLGMLFGLCVAGLALLACRRAWKTFLVTAATVGVLLVALALLNVPRSPLAPFARVGVLERLSHLSDVRRGTPVWFRLQVWGGILSGWGRQIRGEEVIPETRPWVRSALGYGLETQLLTLDQLSLPAVGVFETQGEGWRGQYLVDRAHNALLDELVTGGLVGAGLWLTSVGCVLAAGIARVRAATSGEETTVRLGCLGAVLAHLAEGQVGIVTAMPLALLWMTAGVLATAPWSVTDPRSAAVSVSSRTRRPLRKLAMVAMALVAVLTAGLETRWLLASVAYADGARRHIAGQVSEAYAKFRRSRELMPWLPLPVEAFASTALRLAGSESSPPRRLGMLHEGEGALAEARRHALGDATSWALTARITLAEAGAGERDKLPMSLEAFRRAAGLRPRDASLMAQWGWAWLQSGDPAQARQTAERALALPGGRREWLAWVVLALSAREMGDAVEARRAASRVRRLAPPEARRLVEGIP